MPPRDILSNENLSLLFQDNYLSALSFLPRIFWALFVFLLGLIIAKWAKSLTISALSSIDFNSFLKRTKFASLTQDQDVATTISQVASEVIKWLVIYLFLMNAFTILGLTSIAEFMSRVLSYTPNILDALVIFLLAVFLAGFAENFVKRAVSKLDPITGRLVGKVTSYAVVVMGALIALSELGIAERFITIVFIGFVTTISIALGLAIGLGSKEVVATTLNDWHSRYYKLAKPKSPPAKKK